MAHKSTKRTTNGLPKSTAAATAIMTDAPFVIATRLTQFWLAAASPTAKDQKEAVGMVTEKMLAMQQSAFAMNMAMSKAMVEAGTAMMLGGARKDPTDSILFAGLKPFSSKVSANQKRLSKR